ncbi:MAG: SlyX protein [Woeseiaceae bacterium]|nr:SlyX protein [Woeseiaceae bacterium]
MSDDHLVKIETKLSYQEDLLDQLNSIIIKQQKEIDSLKRELLLLQEKITTINESSENTNMDERPPHY